MTVSMVASLNLRLNCGAGLEAGPLTIAACVSGACPAGAGEPAGRDGETGAASAGEKRAGEKRAGPAARALPRVSSRIFGTSLGPTAGPAGGAVDGAAAGLAPADGAGADGAAVDGAEAGDWPASGAAVWPIDNAALAAVARTARTRAHRFKRRVISIPRTFRTTSAKSAPLKPKRLEFTIHEWFVTARASPRVRAARRDRGRHWTPADRRGWRCWAHWAAAACTARLEQSRPERRLRSRHCHAHAAIC